MKFWTAVAGWESVSAVILFHPHPSWDEKQTMTQHPLWPNSNPQSESLNGFEGIGNDSSVCFDNCNLFTILVKTFVSFFFFFPFATWDCMVLINLYFST